jgi:hypothetical protein
LCEIGFALYVLVPDALLLKEVLVGGYSFGRFVEEVERSSESNLPRISGRRGGVEILYSWHGHGALGAVYYTTLISIMTDTAPRIRPLSRAFLSDLIMRAVNAPSGDNSQPWQFRVADDTITLFNMSDADATLYNFRQRGSYFAHGALIENLALLASTEGYRLDAALFPDIPNATAHLSFTAETPKKEPLASVIERRATNRKPYKRIPLAAQDRAALLDAVTGVAGTELRFVEGEDRISLLARTVSVNERLLMENRTLHDFLFNMIRWSRSEESVTPGLYIKTMEFPPPVQVLFRFVLRFWPIVKILNIIGLSRFIPKQSAQGYRASSAFGAIVLTGDTDADFIFAGRAFERVWLTATALGVSVQPVTAIPYLAQRVVAGAATAFVPSHQEMIREANDALASAFHLQGREHIAMLFRVGYGDAPTATSSKAAPVILES